MDHLNGVGTIFTIVSLVHYDLLIVLDFDQTRNLSIVNHHFKNKILPR
jgi:hypothetical protein